MRLLPDLSPKHHEDTMQQEVAEYMKNRNFRHSDPYNWNDLFPTVYREVRIHEIGRISDVIVKITDRRIINIECKMMAYGEVVKQAIDHLEWADYSYICMWADTNLPSYVVRGLINTGIGLLLWKPGFIVEPVQSSHNKHKNKKVRKAVMDILNKIDQKTTGKKEAAGQLVAL